MKPLEGVRIIDFSRAMAGPYCTMILGDLGADVIKIERPGTGDDSRSWGPPFIDAGQQLSAYFACANRNKRSVALDLKSPVGQRIAHELIAHSDVLVENFRLGVMDRLGLGYQQLAQDHRSLLYCSITGYGRTGPAASLPGYDIVMQAEGGLMSITGPRQGQPFRLGVPIVDITSGMFAAISILAALRVRESTGKGQLIDVSLLETSTALLSNVASNFLIGGQAPERWGNDHPNLAPYGAYEASDGWLVVGVANQSQWKDFCRIIGEPAIEQDQRFTNNHARLAHREALSELLADIFKQDTVVAWLNEFRQVGVPCGPINDVAEVFNHPQQAARQLALEMNVAGTGQVRTPGFPYSFSETPAEVRLPPPFLGEHTAEVLTELLGYSEQQASQIAQAQTAAG
jgi:formyl-CoA transferase